MSLNINTSVLSLRRLRYLLFHTKENEPGHLSAASGLTVWKETAYVIPDDEVSLGLFSLRDPHELGRTVSFSNRTLPKDLSERKKVKDDLEALTLIASDSNEAQLIAIPSGSKSNRVEGVWLRISSSGALLESRRVDYSSLYERIKNQLGIKQLNIEGVSLLDNGVVFAQRGNSETSANGLITLVTNDLNLDRWRTTDFDPSGDLGFHAMDLGVIDSVRVSITDISRLESDSYVFVGAAEDTGNAYDDGPSKGSILGLASFAHGAFRYHVTHRLETSLKIEGVHAFCDQKNFHFYFVSDADDRSTAAQLLYTSCSISEFELP